jgi:hypothetical protein
LGGPVPRAKKFRFAFASIRWLLPLIPPQSEGRIAIVTDVGSGMRWTRWCRQTSDVDADGEVVWSWRPLAGVKLATMLCIVPMTVTQTSRTPGRARRKPLKPLARGRPGPARLNLW